MKHTLENMVYQPYLIMSMAVSRLKNMMPFLYRAVGHPTKFAVFLK
ncbi:hypothetical protein ABH916_001245 [Peribacillus frigoritolerans]